MNKSEFIDSLQAALGEEASKASAEKALDGVLSTIKKVLVQGDSISFVGFGTFSVAERAARTGINPKTKEKIAIAASKAVKFKAGSALKASVQ